MLNNFMEYEYQAYHKIYVHQASNFAIYLGDVSAALDMDFIKKQPINVVVTAALGMDQVSYPNGQVKHIIYPLLDAKSENISKFFNQFYDLVEKQINQGNILVHCAAGISRSATLVISYLMIKHKWTFKQAVKFVRDKRPIILPNLGFQRQLKQFQVIISRQASTAQIQKRYPPSSGQFRNNMYSPIRADFLPDIKNLGQTSFLRSKVLDKNINIRFDPEQVKDFAHKKLQIRSRKSQHDSKALKKKATHFNNFNKEMIYAKIESGRNRLLQRSNNFINMNFPQMDNVFGQQGPISNSKKLSSLSHRSQMKSQDRKLIRNHSNNKHEKNQNLFEDMNKVIVSKLHLNERKFVTQKNLRARGLHRLAQL